jgi:hypothetical protein
VLFKAEMLELKHVMKEMTNKLLPVKKAAKNGEKKRVQILL